MRTSHSVLRIAIVSITAALQIAAPQAHAQTIGKSANATSAGALAALGTPVGARVYLQAWNPQKPDQDTPTAVLDQRSGISGPMNQLWNETRAFLMTAVPQELGKANLIAKGFTLYDIKFNVNPLSAIDLSQGGMIVKSTTGYGNVEPRPNSFVLHWRIPGTYLSFKSTTPDAGGIGAPRGLDPALSFQIDLDITIGGAVSDAPGQPYLQVTEVQVLAQNFVPDSHNPTGDILLGVTNFVTAVATGKSFGGLVNAILNGKNLAADPAHGGFGFGSVQTYDLQGMANDKLRPLNDAITASGVRNYLRTGVWVKPLANGKMLTLLFAPKALPLPPLQGTMAGTVSFDSTVTAKYMPSTCNGFLKGAQLNVEIQTGPRPVLDVDPFSFGRPPMQRLTNVSFTGQQVANRQCNYVLTGLALLYPNNIAFPPPALGTNGSLGQIATYVGVKPKLWASPVTPMAPNHDLIASMAIADNPGVGARPVNPIGLANQPTNPGDPSIRWGAQNVREQAGQPVVNQPGIGQQAPSSLQPGAKSSLNPQPLPPKVGAGTSTPTPNWNSPAAKSELNPQPLPPTPAPTAPAVPSSFGR